ncbi:UDP-glucosyltransferase 2 [Stomoxys calcitrans]|uniref:UDP-glucosyltransferase 2 n=1 Tax=Stomoxys calcitrans TaxID=35570 RepID=UPI0027E2DF21|nr:UDP-glucosyltransferase 2 [Stomoxys calcitrans]
MKTLCLSRILTLILQILFTSIKLSENAKILAVFPFPGPSQYMFAKPYLKELAARGHQLTVISGYPSEGNGANYRDIALPVANELQEVYMQGALKKRNLWSELTYVSDFLYNVSGCTLRNPQVQELLAKETFDLAIIEAVSTDALYSLGHHFGVPIIGVAPFSKDIIIDDIMGNPRPLAFTPTMATGFTDQMSYGQRLQNVVVQMLELLHTQWIHLPRQQKLLDLYMPHIAQRVETMRKNISLFLLNQHFSLSYGKPLVSNVIEVGGLQIPRQTKPLPKEIRSIIDHSPNDVIFFSMGTNVKSKDFPPHIIQLFNRVFSQLPYTVLWKFENPKLPGKPSNLHINPWFPQSDILAEEKVKLFISHAGLLSTFEAVHYGKPMLVLPIFFDQNLNANNAKEKGFALRLDMATLTEQQFKNSILELMKNRSYSEKIKEISQRYHDQPVKPMDLAIYWTEYVIRHGGAEHLRSPAQKMDFLQKHSIDTIGVLVMVAVLAICIFNIILGRICKLLKSILAIKKKVD